MMSLTNYYFFLSLSPWPILISCSVFNLASSFLFFLKFADVHIFLLSMLLVSTVAMMWWSDYSKEFSESGKESFSLEGGIKMSMILFITSEILFFVSFFWSYFHFSITPLMEASFYWPPMGLKMFDHASVPLINTLILLTSGGTVTLSHMFMIKGSFKNCYNLLLATVLLGISFSYLQYDEYVSAFFTMSDSVFGTCFFILTGFHGIHVMVGTLYLAWVLFMSSKKNVQAKFPKFRTGFLMLTLCSRRLNVFVFLFVLP